MANENNNVLINFMMIINGDSFIMQKTWLYLFQ